MATSKEARKLGRVARGLIRKRKREGRMYVAAARPTLAETRDALAAASSHLRAFRNRWAEEMTESVAILGDVNVYLDIIDDFTAAVDDGFSKPDARQRVGAAIEGLNRLEDQVASMWRRVDQMERSKPLRFNSDDPYTPLVRAINLYHGSDLINLGMEVVAQVAVSLDQRLIPHHVWDGVWELEAYKDADEFDLDDLTTSEIVLIFGETRTLTALQSALSTSTLVVSQLLVDGMNDPALIRRWLDSHDIRPRGGIFAGLDDHGVEAVESWRPEKKLVADARKLADSVLRTVLSVSFGMDAEVTPSWWDDVVRAFASIFITHSAYATTVIEWEPESFAEEDVIDDLAEEMLADDLAEEIEKLADEQAESEGAFDGDADPDEEDEDDEDEDEDEDDYDELSPREQGRFAFENLCVGFENPYTKTDPRHKLWIKGYKAAEKAAAKSEPVVEEQSAQEPEPEPEPEVTSAAKALPPLTARVANRVERTTEVEPYTPKTFWEDHVTQIGVPFDSLMPIQLQVLPIMLGKVNDGSWTPDEAIAEIRTALGVTDEATEEKPQLTAKELANAVLKTLQVEFTINQMFKMQGEDKVRWKPAAQSCINVAKQHLCGDIDNKTMHQQIRTTIEEVIASDTQSTKKRKLWTTNHKGSRVTITSLAQETDEDVLVHAQEYANQNPDRTVVFVSFGEEAFTIEAE